MKNLSIISGITTSLVIGLQLPLVAGTFTEINFFGDSLLDQGNFFSLTSLPPSPPYDNGRFSNGKLLSDLLAENFNLNPTLSTQLTTTIPTQGVNFAFAGAGTGVNNAGGNLFPGLQNQITSFTDLTRIQPPKPDGLSVLWAGANDYNEAFFNPTSLTVPLEELPDQVTSNLSNGVESLYDLGVRNFLVVNLPDLGITPLANTLNKINPNISTQLTNLVTAHNNLLELKLAEIDNSLSGINISLLDAEALLSEIVTEPSKFGITNLEDSCLTNFRQPGLLFDAICPNPDEFLFWDDIHPTARINQLLAESALEVLELEVVPESSNNLGLFFVMFLGLPSLITNRKKIKS